MDCSTGVTFDSDFTPEQSLHCVLHVKDAWHAGCSQACEAAHEHIHVGYEHKLLKCLTYDFQHLPCYLDVYKQFSSSR